MCDTNPFTAPFSFHSPKDDRLFKKDDRVLSQTRPRFLKRRSFLSYKLFVVIYTKECINLQIREVHCIRHIIGTPTDWFSAWSDDGVKVTMVISDLLQRVLYWIVTTNYAFGLIKPIGFRGFSSLFRFICSSAND